MELFMNVQLYTPFFAGKKNILSANGKILRIFEEKPSIETIKDFKIKVINCGGLICTPGFVDGHVHLIGGGGEGGFSTRTAEGNPEIFFKAGTTAVIGMLGTDCITRDHKSLLAKVRGMKEAGLNAFMLTGSYRYPPKTITGDVMQDIVLIPEIIGFGELAVSDHRGSDISPDELKRLGLECRVAGMLSGKAGKTVIHMGDSPSGLTPLKKAVEDKVLPPSQLLPTHISRNGTLLEEGISWILDYDGYIDFTAEKDTSEILTDLINREVCLSKILVSTDGLGSLPVFNEKKELIKLESGPVDTLMKTFRSLVTEHNLSVEKALQPFTKNPADFFRLQKVGSGEIKEGSRADFILFSPDIEVQAVIAEGEIKFMTEGFEDGR